MLTAANPRAHVCGVSALWLQRPSYCFQLGCVAYCFFSSRRRHTRCLSDWSSDVCSSDLDQFGRRAIGAVKIGFAPGFRDDAKDLTQRRKDAKMSFPLYWGIWFHNLPLQFVEIL